MVLGRDGGVRVASPAESRLPPPGLSGAVEVIGFTTWVAVSLRK